MLSMVYGPQRETDLHFVGVGDGFVVVVRWCCFTSVRVARANLALPVFDHFFGRLQVMRSLFQVMRSLPPLEDLGAVIESAASAASLTAWGDCACS